MIMISLWMFIFLRLSVHQTVFASPPRQTDSNKVVTAFVGELFLTTALQSQNFTKWPRWMCQRGPRTQSVHEGIPLSRDTGTHIVNDQLSIIVVQKREFIFHNQCKHRWPTILALFGSSAISKLSACARIDIRKTASQYLDENVHFVEDTRDLIKSISILTQWPDTYYQPTASAIVFSIGCGAIPDSRLATLKLLEHPDFVKKLSRSLHYPIGAWIIADIQDRPLVRRKRNSRDLSNSPSHLSGSSLYLYEKQQRQEWPEDKIVIQGSGYYYQPYVKILLERSTKVVSTSTVSTTTATQKPPVIESDTVPIVNKRLNNVTVFIGSKIRYQILPDTYFDLEDGYNDRMTLKVYIRSADMQTDYPVSSNSSKWIYYVPDSQEVVFQPGRMDAGKYNLVICAYDSHRNRICDGIIVDIMKPQTKTIRSYMDAPTGVLWKYIVPRTWADAVKSSNKDQLEVTVDSSSIFEWMANSSTINLITEASVSREHQLKLMAESQDSGRKVIWSIVVTSMGHNAYISATSVQIVVRLSSVRLGKVPLSIVNVLKEKIISAIVRYSHNRYSTPRDILIYKILHGRDAFLSNILHDKSLTLSMIYAPKRAASLESSSPVTCLDVVISPEMLRQIRFNLVESQSLWMLESVMLRPVPGKCQQNLLPDIESSVVSTTATSLVQRSNGSEISTWLNKTINITVRNGFIFKKIIAHRFQSEYKLILKMELMDENNLITDDSSWVSVSSSSSSSSSSPEEFALYGLPLADNVRSRAYDFRLNVILRSGASQSVTVTILVEQFTPRFDHRFEMILRISESDTVAHRSPFAMDQLLISQTLSYRWLLVQTLGSFLQSGRCLPQCGMDVFTHSLFEQRTWVVRFSWSVLVNIADSLESSVDSLTTCDHSRVKSLVNSLVLSDPTTDYLLSIFPTSITNLSASPSDDLIKLFTDKHLGKPSLISAQVLSSCSSYSSSSSSKNTADRSPPDILWSNITVFQGNIFVINLISPGLISDPNNQRISHSLIYYTNDTICNLRWLTLSSDGSVLYGLPLESDIRETSLFLLRIEIVFDGNVRRNFTLRISVKSYFDDRSHVIVMEMQLADGRPRNSLDVRIKVVQLINQYLHPSCTIIRETDKVTPFKYVATNNGNGKLLSSCEKAEDVVLHSLEATSDHDKTVLIIKWSKMSFVANRSQCHMDHITTINRDLLEKSPSKEVSRELRRFFTNSGFGFVTKLHLCLYDACQKSTNTDQTILDLCLLRPGNVYQPAVGSTANTKIVLLVLFLVIVAIGSIFLGVYFLKRGISDGGSTFKSKETKDGHLVDHSPEPKNSIKSPLPSFSKKPKKLIMQDSTGINLTNNSPSTPLLSPFTREESKSTRNMESMFTNDDNTGSYSFAASRAKSPDPEISSSPEPAVPMCAVKQPNTSNVIRNPAMMMGSRLNPYRNIPPQII